MSSPKSISPVLVKVEEACTALGIGRTHFYRLVSDGVINPVKIGSNRVRVHVDEIRAVPERLRERHHVV